MDQITHTQGFPHTFAICAYGQSSYLTSCIESVLAQQGCASEVYIATSTPSDWLNGIAQQYGLPVYVNRGETGIGQDWNFAYTQATSTYVTIAHQDDIYLPQYAHTAVETMDGSKRPLILFTDYAELRGDDVVTDNRLLRVKRLLLHGLRDPRNWGRVSIRRRALSVGSAICCPTVCINKGLFPTSPFVTAMKSNLDWDTWETMTRDTGDFCYVPRILLYHRIHEDSATSRLIQDNTRANEDYQMLCRFWPVSLARVLNHFYARGMASNRV